MAVSQRQPFNAFLADPQAHITRLRKSGEPEAYVLDDSGGAVVVQDSAAYQELLDRLELLESSLVVRERLEGLQRGESTLSLDELSRRLGTGSEAE